MAGVGKRPGSGQRVGAAASWCNEPLEPGERVKVLIEPFATCNLFKAGHRIRLEIANADSMFTDSFFAHQYMPYKVGRDTILHGAAQASRLILPIVPARKR